MDKKELILTPEGRQKLVDELAYREGEKHEEIVERLKEARGFGDLSENSTTVELSDKKRQVNQLYHCWYHRNRFS